MKPQTPSERLSLHIANLEQKRDRDLDQLKGQLRLTGQSLKPATLVKDAAKELLGSTRLPSVLLKTALGLAVGYFFMRKKNKQVDSHTSVQPSNQIDHKKSLGQKALDTGLFLLTDPRASLLRAAALVMARRLWIRSRDRRNQKQWEKDQNQTYALQE